MNTAIIVQARMTSTRLPGKVLKTVLGKPLLQFQIERLRRASEADGIILATTANESDRPLWELADRLAVPIYRGSEEDVLQRYSDAASQHGVEMVVRCTSDCPLIDPAIVDRVIRFFKDNRNSYDYVSNTLQRSYPRGMDTEVFSAALLKQIANAAKNADEREHVTPYIYRRPQSYRIGQVIHWRDESNHRWTVDTLEDFELIQRLLTSLYPNTPDFTMEDVLTILHQHPEWATLNAHVIQKTVPR